MPYQDFVDAIYKLYPGSDVEQHQSIADIDKIVGETSRVGILSLTNLGKYHREFITITTFLITKSHISTTEQSHAFAHGFPLELWGWVCHCLQLKFPDHFPDDPYTLEEIHNAAQFVLHGTMLFLLALDDLCTPAKITAPKANDKPTMKSEELSALIDIMKQAIAKLGNQGAQVSKLKAPTPRDYKCHFCRGDHFKSESDGLKEYVHNGKCILHNNGYVALPGGCFIPGAITGKTFKELIDEWHRQNSSSTATTNSLLFGVLPEPTVSMFQLSVDECIKSLEKEIFVLRMHKQMKGVCTQTQKAHNSDHAVGTPPEIIHHPKHQEGLSTPPQASQQSKPTMAEKSAMIPPNCLSIHSLE